MSFNLLRIWFTFFYLLGDSRLILRNQPSAFGSKFLAQNGMWSIWNVIKFKICSKWNLIKMECDQNGICSKKYVLKMECDQFGMWSKRNVIKMECDQNGMWPKWNVTKMECDQNGMWPKWNVIKMEPSVSIGLMHHWKSHLICTKPVFKTTSQQFIIS